MKRFPLRLALCAGLVVFLLDCSGQATDSTAKKPTLRQRIDRAMERRREMIQQRQLPMDAGMRRRVEIRDSLASRPLLPVDGPNRWSLSVNPLGILEPQMAVGLGIGYHITANWQVWVESSVLGQLYSNPAQSCIGGFREILAVKYYLGRRQGLFFAGEFRWKQAYYHDVANFENDNGDQLNKYTYRFENIVLGGGFWFGGRIRLSADHRWQLEPSIGLGLKGRTVYRQNVPDGYFYHDKTGGFDFTISDIPRQSTQVTLELPASVRLFYVF
jgi:hypothetical protein